MKKLFYALNFILLIVLIYIIQYPVIKKGEKIKVKIAYHPSVASFPLFVALEKKIFEKLKLEPEVIKTSSYEALDNLKRGKVDIVVGFPTVDFFIREREEIDNFRIIADVSISENFLYASIFGFGRLKKIDDIKNFPFYAPSQRMEGRVIGKKLADNYAFSLDNFFEYPTVIPQVSEGGVLIYYPTREYFAKKGANILIEDVFKSLFGENFVIGSVLCSKVTLAYNKKAMERFREVWDQALDYINNNKEEILSLYKSFCIQHLEADFLKEGEFDLRLPYYKKSNEVSDLPYLAIVRILKNLAFIYSEPDLGVLFELK
ncbi:MAG: hypothetical protein ABDH49_03165 [Candidatus Hydrothermales bacterium]